MSNRISNIFTLTFLSSLSVSHLAFAAAHYLPEYEDKWGGFSSNSIPLHSNVEDANKSCHDAGYTITTCPAGFATKISERCPFSIDKNYYKKCYSLAEMCMEKGYTSYCGEGYEFDNTQSCNYDSLYKKCKCATCEGYTYTETEANTLGYEPDGEPCNSCGIDKFKRKASDCSGYDYDSSSCGVSSCATLAGSTCQSGNILKYKECTPCPVPGCETGMINMDTYWCEGALKCWWPEPSGGGSCTQTACFDYAFSENVTCQNGMTKESCTDSCVGTRYKCTGTATCTPTKDCSAYTLPTQSGCPNGYESCADGCGKTAYKCKAYAVGDTYYSGGMLIGKVIEIQGNNLVVASVPKVSSAEIIDFCDAMSPGTWYIPNHIYGKKIFNSYRSSLTSPTWSYIRIKIGSHISGDYCVNDTTWSTSTCNSSSYTLYNSCLTAAQQIN